jgi:poly-gamma-glutamate synthesis protein (capsule biosynthesis protein)
VLLLTPAAPAVSSPRTPGQGGYLLLYDIPTVEREQETQGLAARVARFQECSSRVKEASLSQSRRRFLQLAAGVSMAPPLSRPVAPALHTEQLELRQAARDEIVVAIAGDLFLTSALEPPDRDAEAVAEIMRGADASFANLENGLSTVGAPELGGFRQGAALRGHPSLVAELVRLRLSGVSLANNHTGNYGREALIETLETLDRAGLARAGAGRNVDEAFAPAIVSVRDRRIAFLSLYSYYYNFEANDVADATRPGIARSRAYDVALQVPSGYDTTRRDESPYRIDLRANPPQVVMAPLHEDMERMSAVIRAAKMRADFVILSVHIHWGRHNRADLPLQQQTLARAAIDAGADVFVGHGPHILRGIELYRERPILYSIANFMLRPAEGRAAVAAKSELPAPGRESIVARLALAPGKVPTVELLPIHIGADGRPRFAVDARGVRTLHTVSALSAALGTTIIQEGWRAVVA